MRLSFVRAFGRGEEESTMTDGVLVVGSTGLVGLEVVRELAVRGCTVKAASRSGGIAGVETAHFDFARPGTMDAALQDVDRVFLLAPSWTVARTDEIVTPFVEKMKGAGVRRVVCMTALTADRPGAPLNGLENAVAESGLEYTLLRPNWFNQNFAPGHYMASIRAAGGVFLPAADAPVSFVDTRDIGAVAATALLEDGHDGKAYTLTGPQAITHGEACRILSRAAGREIRYVAIGEDDMRRALGNQDMPEEAIEGMIRLFALVRDGSCEPVTADVEFVLDREPISFARYADDYAKLFGHHA